MATLSFFGTLQLTDVKKVRKFFDFFLQFLVFLRFSVKKRHSGVLSVNSLLLFDPVEMMRFLGDCGKYLFSTFLRALSVFPKLSFS